MTEKILKIEEKEFGLEGSSYYYDGFIITTDKQVIKMGIESGQSCCENYGYFMTNDNVEDFIGSSLLSVNVVDKSLNITKLESLELMEAITMFVNFETDIGTLQFTAYNEHNGYYSHGAVIESKQLKETMSL